MAISHIIGCVFCLDSDTKPTGPFYIGWRLIETNTHKHFFSSDGTTWDQTTAAGSGETNTMSNVGVGGVGPYRSKTGVNFDVKNINAGSTKIAVSDDVPNSEIKIDVNQGNLSLTALGGIVETSVADNHTLYKSGSNYVNRLPQRSQYYAVVFQDTDLTTTTTPVTTRAIKWDGTPILNGTSGTDDATVINAALAACDGKGRCYIAPARYRSNTAYYPAWLIGANINISSLTLTIEGSELQGAGNAFGKTILRKTFAGAGDLITDNNTSGLTKRIKNITLQGGNPENVGDTNLGTGIGINVTNAQNERYLDNVTIERFDVGLKGQKLVYHTCHDVTINLCTTYGVWYLVTGGPINTVYWTAGRVTNCGINVFLDTGSNDTGWFGTVMEAGITSNLKIAATSNGHNFYSVSQEINPTPLGRADPAVVIDDAGNNNSYIANRFMTNDRSGINAIIFRSTAHRNKVDKCWFGGPSNGAIYIKIESGSDEHIIDGNTSSANTAPRVIILDANLVKNHKSRHKDSRTTMALSPEIKRTGSWQGVLVGSSIAVGCSDLLQGMMNVIASSGSRQTDSSPLRSNFDTTTTINTIRGINVFNWANRIKDPRFYLYFRLEQLTNVRIFLGFNSAGNTTPVSSADHLASRSGIGFWFDPSTDSHWQISSNSGSANATLVPTTITPDLLWHGLEINGWDALTKFQWSYDGSIPADVTTPIPAQTTGLGNYFTVENTAAEQKILDLGFLHIEEATT